jgi:hypothetical protein
MALGSRASPAPSNVLVQIGFEIVVAEHGVLLAAMFSLYKSAVARTASSLIQKILTVWLKERGFFEMTEHASEATASASQIFAKIEQIIYFVVGLLLAATATFALLSAAISVWGDVLSLGAPEETLVTIDRLLFVLMLVEVLHTARVSVREGRLTAEPFLVVGLIASIRRVLAITLGSSHATHLGNWTPDVQERFNASMLELGVLAVLILVMVFAIYLLRHKPRPTADAGP